jgi:ATP-dependent DNA ligase
MSDDWRDELSDEARGMLLEKALPRWAPLLATLTNERLSSPEWIYECRLDGERCLVFRRKGRVRILSRNKQDLNNTYRQEFVVGGYTDPVGKRKSFGALLPGVSRRGKDGCYSGNRAFISPVSTDREFAFAC